MRIALTLYGWDVTQQTQKYTLAVLDICGLSLFFSPSDELQLQMDTNSENIRVKQNVKMFFCQTGRIQICTID